MYSLSSLSDLPKGILRTRGHQRPLRETLMELPHPNTDLRISNANPMYSFPLKPNASITSQPSFWVWALVDTSFNLLMKVTEIGYFFTNSIRISSKSWFNRPVPR